MQFSLCKNGWRARDFWRIVSSNLFHLHMMRGKQTGMANRQTGQFKPFQAEVTLFYLQLTM